MKEDKVEQNIINRLVRWAESQTEIRALILTSTRTNPDAVTDAFSDYDVILAVTDFRRFLEDDKWLEDFSRVLAVYRDPVRLEYGMERFCRVTQYEDGTKIDYMVWPVELLRRVAIEPVLPPGLDIGYTVLLDKDRLTENLKPPTFTAYIPSVPSEKEYYTLVEHFFSNTPYVAKHICRGDLLPLKYCLDYVMKYEYLLRILEWRIEIDWNWQIRPGAYGKGLKKLLPPEVWEELESTYTGSEAGENWEALFRTIDLFRKTAGEVGGRLGYNYPLELDQRVVKYLHKIQASKLKSKSPVTGEAE